MIFEPFKKLLNDLRKHRLDIVAQQGSRNAAYHYDSMANSLERAILQAEAIQLAAISAATQRATAALNLSHETPINIQDYERMNFLVAQGLNYQFDGCIVHFEVPDECETGDLRAAIDAALIVAGGEPQ